ncbi:unnamed protein product [Rotaria sordida]|uniref:Nuclear receptor domain-containing protein n=1 Tax=Rotaria sordida TaxID=392033 RepID=A0A815JZ46_9BILA|nr:unnamed protein product [Rotaria sordida]CAF1388615.1 unnamed protein product [Rotaria sordida]CAF1397109.1 unnamed protein product [Rotaria sordida]CAF3724096.1 unnamed protein product [Rotaria sordida]CAF3728655.1 unnamed protein product [Rotaria sordida]
MDPSFEMFNRSSYFPIYSHPLSVPSEISSFRSNNNITTNDYSSYYPDNIPTYPSNVYTNSRSHSPINQPNIAGVDISIDRYNNSSLSLLNSRSDRCLVCNDRASGIHFGVSTCEACKAFFRRSSISSYSICQPCSPIRCEINIKNRNNCPSCRFDKCKRLGMDRDNVIYGKPSKQQIHSFYHQDYFIEQLTNISNELIKIFQNIHSIYQTSLLNTFENKQQIDNFAQILFQLFYQQTLQIHNINPSDVIHRIFILIFDSYKNNLIFDYYFIQYINLRAIISLWLFVYYYETFLLKQKISQNKLSILIKLLDMELMKINEYYSQDQNKQKFFKIHFINTFTILADHLQEIHSDK